MTSSGSILGNAVLRLEDPTLLTGTGKYLDDLVEPGMLHVAFVRSMVAHGVLDGVDVSEAEAMPGVRAVYPRRQRSRAAVAADVPDDAAGVESPDVLRRPGEVRR